MEKKQPSEQKIYRIDEMLKQHREAYTDSKRTKCNACRANFDFVAGLCLDKTNSVSQLTFTSIRKARAFFNCSECNSKYTLNHKAQRVEDVKTKRFENSFKSDSETFLDRYETLSGIISFPVAVYNSRVYPLNFSPKSYRKGKRPP